MLLVAGEATKIYVSKNKLINISFELRPAML